MKTLWRPCQWRRGNWTHGCIDFKCHCHFLMSSLSLSLSLFTRNNYRPKITLSWYKSTGDCHSRHYGPGYGSLYELSVFWKTWSSMVLFTNVSFIAIQQGQTISAFDCLEKIRNYLSVIINSLSKNGSVY